MRRGPQGEFEWAGMGAFGCLLLLLLVVVGFALTRAL